MTVRMLEFPDKIEKMITIIQHDKHGRQTIPQIYVGNTVIPCITADTEAAEEQLTRWMSVLKTQVPEAEFELVRFSRSV